MSATGDILYSISVWLLPALLAITLHEAAHGYVAGWFGDDTAKRMGRVSLNPLRHVDPVGTVLIPALLILSRAPFVFGYAKPVPVDFARLNNPRRDMIFVALAGPVTNLILALIAALLYHGVTSLPPRVGPWVAANLDRAILLNVLLAVFNMLPIPPLDGGRVAVGLLPNTLAYPLARLEPYGIFIVIGGLFLLPWLGNQVDLDLDLFSWLIEAPASAVIAGILDLAGHD
jgi:Zn-dependent protease